MKELRTDRTSVLLSVFCPDLKIILMWEPIYKRVSQIDPKISPATVYRTLRLFEEAHILNRHKFGDGRSRYEKAIL